MKKSSSSIIIINEAKNIGVQDHDDDYLNMMQKDKEKIIEKFEKYKPKVSDHKKEETNIEEAESKVKSLLSLFLHNIETEEKKDKHSNSLFLNEIESVKKIQKLNKFEETKKINIYYDRINSNILDKKKQFNKIGLISSPNLTYIRAHSLQFAIHDDKKNIIKRKSSAKKNREKSNFYKNRKNGSLIKDNIEVNKTENFKASLGFSSNQNMNFIKKNSSLVVGGKNILKTFNSVDINKKCVKNNTIKKLSLEKVEKELSENKSRNKLKNSFNISNKIKNNLYKNGSKLYSILNNDSKTILKNLTESKDEIKIEDQNKDSSLVAKNLEWSDITSSYINKNKSNSLTKTSNISMNKKKDNSLVSKKSFINKNNKKRKFLTNKGLHGIMRAITSSIGINKDLFKKETNKLLRAGTVLKSLQERLKQSIILRPGDLVLNFPEGTKPSVKKERTISSKEKKEPKNSLSSQSKISHLNNKNELVVSKTNLNEIKKTEDIPIEIQYIDKNQEQMNQMISKDLLKNETDEEIQDISQAKFIKIHEKYRIFIHRNQVYDSLDDEEIEDEVSNYIYFSPDSKFILIFDAILLFFALFSLFWIPFYLAHNLNFCNERKLKFTTVLNLFIEFMNLLDLFLGFFKAYYNFEEQTIKKNFIIAKNYLTGWFIIDIVSAIPFYSIFKFQEKKCNTLDFSTRYYDNVLHNLNYLYMCNRILKMMKVCFANKAYQYLSNNYQERRPFLKLIIYLIRMSCLFFIFHFCACLYIFIGRNSYPNWILYTKLEIKPFADIYVCAIYMLITTLTTVGYGDITCYSLQERLFQLFLLIIGIMSYSFAVSSFSNYIQKINEKSVEFEKKKDILDDIKLNNPNLPDKLYDRILRYLKYKNLSEKRDKNIILDSLPVGLKNNLICEMYKPIIQNFICFKNFENTDFIVRVILSFRPIIAIKKDILVNEGDIIEDIIFVKKGVLSVELPINIKNPQENVDKYLNMTIFRIEKGPDLEKIGDSTIINNTNISINNTNILGNTVMPGEEIEKQINKIKTDDKKSSDETTYVKLLNIRENEHFGDVLMFLEKRSPLRLRVKSKKAELFFLNKTDALKISSIYQNIWRRINKKSVFNFEQIKKSIHKIVEIYCAFKTIKTLNENNGNIKKRKTYKKTMRISKRKLKLALEINQKIKSKSEKKILNWKNKYFDDIIVKTKLHRNKSSKKSSNKTLYINSSSFSNNSIYNNGNRDDSDIEKPYQKNILNKKEKTSIPRSLNENDIRYKFYKGENNKYKLNDIDSIINEEPGNEGTITPIKKNKGSTLNKSLSIKYNNLNKSSSKKYNLNKSSSKKYNLNKTSSINHNFRRAISIQKGFEKSTSSKICVGGNSKSNLDIFSNKIKFINEREEFEDEGKDNNSSSDNSDDKKKKKIKKKCNRSYGKSKSNKKEMHSSSDSDKNNIMDESNVSSLSSNKNENSNITSNLNDMSDNYFTPFKKEDINEEIYPHEIFNISKKEDNWFSRQIKLPNILNQLQNDQDNLTKNNINNNNKYQFLINSDKNKSINNQNNINQIQIINNNIENINTNLNMSKKTNEIKLSTKNCNNYKIYPKTNDSSLSKVKIIFPYSIIKIIEIKYNSLYENLNQITNYKYSSNIELQNKVRKIIIESSILTTSNTNTLHRKHTVSNFNKNLILNYDKQTFLSTINPLTKIKNTCSFYHMNSITDQKLNEFYKNNNKNPKITKRNSPLKRRSETFSDTSEPKKIRSTSIDNYKAKKSYFQTGIGNSLNNKNISFARKFGIKPQKTFKNKHELKIQKTNNIESFRIKKINGEKTEFPNVSGFLGEDFEQKSSRMNPNFFNKKKKLSIFTQINLNIEKTNQNLNHPEEFYTNYFNSILDGTGDQTILEPKRCRRKGSGICFVNKIILPPLKNSKNKKKK